MLKNNDPKVLVIGLDCAGPRLVFEQWRDELPNLKWLMDNGTWGNLTSSIPAITVPAWTSMLSSKDPGQLGFYGFRNRVDYSYDKMRIATSNAVREARVWDILSRAGKRSIVVGVPQTYPIRPLNGIMVSGFLTPSTRSNYVYPAELRDEVNAVVGEYMIDVHNFRTEDKAWLLGQIHEMTEKRFRLIRHFVQHKPWDFFMFVEMGVDRLHHGFWKYHDVTHRKHEPGNPFEDSIANYYKVIDREIGTLLALIDDDTAVIVASDHGVKKMDGGICLNEWLVQEGYLTLKEKPRKILPLDKVEIDWSRTKAWGAGGYYGRIFLNVAGREPQGIIPQSEYERERDMLAEKLKAIPDDQGQPINSRTFKPHKIYQEVRNIPPDLLVYFGDLCWRSVGSVGLDQIHILENDTGPDDANHAQDGMFILYDPRSDRRNRVEGAHLMDIAPTILDLLGVPAPPDMQGKSAHLRGGK